MAYVAVGIDYMPSHNEMTDETREELLNLYWQMVLEHQYWDGESIRSDLPEETRNQMSIFSRRYSYFGDVLDGIRLSIAESGYDRNNKHELRVILRFLREVENVLLRESGLADKLQRIIKSLGNPPSITVHGLPK